MGMGRPTKYNEEVNQVAIDYLTNFETEWKHGVPTVDGLSLATGIANSTLYKWADENKGNFSETLTKLQQVQHVTLASKGLKGEFTAPITKLMLANHGYSDKTDHSHGLSDDLSKLLNSAANSGGLPIAE